MTDLQFLAIFFALCGIASFVDENTKGIQGPLFMVAGGICAGVALTR